MINHPAIGVPRLMETPRLLRSQVFQAALEKLENKLEESMVPCRKTFVDMEVSRVMGVHPMDDL